MRYLKTFENFNDDGDIDEDYVLNQMKDKHGWGDLSPKTVENFMGSDYYSGTTDNTKFVDEFHNYMFKIQTGEIEDYGIDFL